MFCGENAKRFPPRTGARLCAPVSPLELAISSGDNEITPLTDPIALAPVMTNHFGLSLKHPCPEYRMPKLAIKKS